MGKRSRTLIAILLTAAIAGAAVLLAVLRGGGPETGRAAGGPESEVVPTGHPQVSAPAALGGARAESVYQAIIGVMGHGYAASGDPVTEAYRYWARYNRVPYRSPQHGDRFVNVYANEIAHRHGVFAGGGPMPEGAQVAKDSFIVTRRGDVLAGPFFLMEKLAPGASPDTGDWRYMMIDAEGTIVGISGERNAARMRACDACHAKAPAGQDRLHPPPDRARKPAE